MAIRRPHSLRTNTHPPLHLGTQWEERRRGAVLGGREEGGVVEEEREERGVEERGVEGEMGAGEGCGRGGGGEQRRRWYLWVSWLPVARVLSRAGYHGQFPKSIRFRFLRF